MDLRRRGCAPQHASRLSLTDSADALHTESEELSQEISTPMHRGWRSFGEVDSGQLQGQGSLGRETPRVRKGKAPSSPSTKKSWPWWSGARADVPEIPEVEGGRQKLLVQGFPTLPVGLK